MWLRLLWAFHVRAAAAATVTWLEDAVSVSVKRGSNQNITAGLSPRITLSAQHDVLESETGSGHWRVSVGNETTRCFEWHVSGAALQTELNQLGGVLTYYMIC